jgi:hypothetical protein
MKKTLINLGLTAGVVYVLYRLFKKDDVIPMNKALPVDGTSGFDGSPQELLNPSRKPKYQEYLNEKSLNEESLNAKSLNDESLNEEPKIECTNKNEQNNDSVPENTKLLNKSSKIDDISDEEYSDGDISGEELSDEESEKTKKNRSLF